MGHRRSRASRAWEWREKHQLSRAESNRFSVSPSSPSLESRPAAGETTRGPAPFLRRHHVTVGPSNQRSEIPNVLRWSDQTTHRAQKRGPRGGVEIKRLCHVDPWTFFSETSSSSSRNQSWSWRTGESREGRQKRSSECGAGRRSWRTVASGRRRRWVWLRRGTN